jgi:subtilisin family serine protease
MKMDDIIRYKSNGKFVEIIIKYSGDLVNAIGDLEATAEILSEDFAIVTLPTDNIDKLYRLPETEYLEIPKRLYFMRFSSQQKACIYDDLSFGGTELDGSGTLIGIIDSGIDIYNKDFIDENGNTRIVGVWDIGGTGTPPKGFNIGVEYTAEEINKAINGGKKINFTDTIGHGTAIAGICAGNGRGSRYTGIAPKSELVIVKLGLRNSYARSTDIMRGLKYIKNTAKSLNKPVAINISYGTNDGPHDGTALFEGYINEIADNTVCSICVAMGNEGAAGHHYSGSFKDSEYVHFNVGSNIKSMYMSVWKSFLDDVGIVLTAPNGEKSEAVTSTSRIELTDVIVNVLFSLPSPYSIDTEIYLSFESDIEIPAGIWTIEFVGENIVDGKFDIWLPVTEAVGTDTFFLKPEANISLTLPATALKVISVGGYNQLTETAVDFSGRGYTRDTDYIKPDIVAPAYNVPAPTLGGGVDLFTGTSFATPHVTGAAALIMQWGIVLGNDLFMYGERLKAFLQKGAVRYEGVEYPNRVLGYGKLCFENTMKLLEKSLPSVYIQQSNGEISVSDAAYSEEYYDFVGRQSSFVYEISENKNTVTCRIDDNFYVLYVKKDYYKLNKTMLTNTLGIRQPFVMGLMQYEAALEKSGITMVQNQPYLNLRGNGIVIAVIDTGIDYKNEAFIYEDGTSKIQYIWDQSLQGESEGVCFGTEYDNETINRALAGEIELNTVDEIGHGTALAEIAAGRNGAAPDADLLVVKVKQLKKYLREEMFLDADVPAFESSDLMLGVNYAYNKAKQMNKPVVICLGMGTSQGGHSGQSALEEYITAVSRKYGVCLCAPAGNEGIAKHHTSFDFSSTDIYKDVELTVAQGEAGINIWIWNFIVNSVAVEIISPLGEVVSRLQPIANYSNSFTLSKGGGVVSVMYYIPEDIASDQHTHIRIAKPAMGIWTLRLYNNNHSEGEIHLWLPLTSFIKEETFFISSNPSVTVTNPCTANVVMAVGGYNSGDNSVFAPTGRGPTRLSLIRPFFCAPAVNLNGRSGTSLACAMASGASALMLEWLMLRNGIYTANTIMINAYLVLGAQEVGNEVYPNNIWGYGAMNLYASFENL